MKLSRFSGPQRSLSSMVFAAVPWVPALLSAHPGHYHPDETDEFDSFRAVFFHSHGAFDYFLMVVVAASVFVACFHGRPPVRLGAIIVALGSLVCLQLI